MNTDSFPPLVTDLLTPERLAELGPGTPNEVMRTRLQALTVESLFDSRRLLDRDMARCCLAGLWLYHDFLDESHAISQEVHTPTGSFWHAIMHRREPDAWNSKYWWRRVGSHPVIDQLADECRRRGWTYGDPVAFVDRCEQVRGRGTVAETEARNVQMLEWQLLFAWCWSNAVK